MIEQTWFYTFIIGVLKMTTATLDLTVIRVRHPCPSSVCQFLLLCGVSAFSCACLSVQFHVLMFWCLVVSSRERI